MVVGLGGRVYDSVMTAEQYYVGLYGTMNPDAWIHCNDDGSFPGADGYPINDGDVVYVVSPNYLSFLHNRIQQVDEFHGGPYNSVFQTVQEEFDMPSTQFIIMRQDNPTIRRVTELQRVWRARRQVALTMCLQPLGVMLALKFFCAADWTRWRDYHNHRWWVCQSQDTGMWFYEDLPWIAVQGKHLDGAMGHSTLLFQEASGACMPLWKLLSVTAQGMTRLTIVEQDGDRITLQAMQPHVGAASGNIG